MKKEKELSVLVALTAKNVLKIKNDVAVTTGKFK